MKMSILELEYKNIRKISSLQITSLDKGTQPFVVCDG